MRNVLILTFMFISVCCLGQVPNDLQLSGIKGKVKSMTIDKEFTNGYKSRDVYNYNEEGYLTSDLSYDNKLFSGRFSNNVHCVKGLKYNTFSSANSREVFTKYCDSSDEETTPRNYLESWTADNQKVYVYDMQGAGAEKNVKRFYDKEYKLVREDHYETMSNRGRLYTSSGVSNYKYDVNGDLIEIFQDAVNNGVDFKSVFTNKVVEKDKQGNIKKRLVVFNGDEGLSEYSYEYYD